MQNKKNNQNHTYLALMCSRAGIILQPVPNSQPIQDELFFGEKIGTHFTDLFHDDSKKDVLDFWEEIIKNQASFNKNLKLKSRDSHELLYFNGGVIDDQVLVLGSLSPTETNRRFLEELGNIGRINHLIADHSNMSAHSPDPNEDQHYYHRITQLNSQLLEAHRQLYKEMAQRKKIEEELKNLLNEKETLLKEIHHRVKNNLFVISSLLNIQRRQINDAPTRDALLQLQNRIRSMEQLHEKISLSTDFAKISFPEYLEGLAQHIIASYNIQNSIDIRIHAPGISIRTKEAISLGIIITELITNAFKHAFKTIPNPFIRISIEKQDAHYILSVQNNGQPFPEDIDFRQSPSLGMQIVVNLVQQLRGSIELEKKPLTLFKITFPIY